MTKARDVSSRGGLTQVVPTSIVKGASGTASVSANGTTTFSGTESVQLNGVFSSNYDNYKLEINHSGTAQDVASWVRLGTTAGTSYLYQNARIYSTNIIAASNTSGTSGWYFTLTGGNGYYSSSSMDIYCPNLAQSTRATWLSQTDNGLSYWFTYVGSGLLQTTTQYTDLTFFPGSGTATGTIRVYGYNNG